MLTHTLGNRGPGRLSGLRIGIGLDERRDLDDEACARGLVVLDPDGGIMFGDDMADNREPQTGAAILGGKIGQEEFLLVVGAYAASGVCDYQLDGLGGAGVG